MARNNKIVEISCLFGLDHRGDFSVRITFVHKIIKDASYTYSINSYERGNNWYLSLVRAIKTVAGEYEAVLYNCGWVWTRKE
jgi:hypothetical protein